MIYFRHHHTLPGLTLVDDRRLSRFGGGGPGRTGHNSGRPGALRISTAQTRGAEQAPSRTVGTISPGRRLGMPSLPALAVAASPAVWGLIIAGAIRLAAWIGGGR
jgi:hypothetical protein